MLLLMLACSGSPAPKDKAPKAPAADPSANGTPADGDASAEAADAPEPVDALHLQSIVATSGDHAGILQSGWRPSGDAVAEGVLLRFEEPTRVDGLQLASCGGVATVEIYADGNLGGEVQLDAGQGKARSVETTLRSLYLKVAQSEGEACLERLILTGPDGDLRVRPPRSVGARISASSTLEPADAYHPNYLSDGRADFGWVEGAEGLGEGVTLNIDLDQATPIHALELWNGYQRSEDHFNKNGRVKTLSLSVDGGDEILLEVADTQGPQKLELPEPVTGKRLTLSIAGATAGSRYKDTVISELRLWDAEGPVVLSVSEGERAAALHSELSGSPLDTALGKRFVGVCSDAEESRRELKLRENHSFVYYSSRYELGAMEETDSVVIYDGAWVPTAEGQVKLYGRKHRVEQTWAPYGGDSQQDVTRIAGGEIAWEPVAKMDDAAFEAAMADLTRRGAAGMVGCVVAADRERLAQEGAVFVRGKSLTDFMLPG
ncbi:MAG: hypothetical protein VX899_08905 [Myxococcota bacterium]|nr:hypothetical protein [Myxococcota bacterium]